MTYRKFFEKQLGRTAVKQLPAKWKRHIKRIDDLPRPKKSLSVGKILELMSA